MLTKHLRGQSRELATRVALVALFIGALHPPIPGSSLDRVARRVRLGTARNSTAGAQRSGRYGAGTLPLDEGVARSPSPCAPELIGASLGARAPVPLALAAAPRRAPSGSGAWHPLLKAVPTLRWRPLPRDDGRPPPL